LELVYFVGFLFDPEKFQLPRKPICALTINFRRKGEKGNRDFSAMVVEGKMFIVELVLWV